MVSPALTRNPESFRVPVVLSGSSVTVIAPTRFSPTAWRKSAGEKEIGSPEIPLLIMGSA